MKKPNPFLALWKMQLNLAKEKPWLASHLLRQLQVARERLQNYLIAACFRLGLMRPRKVLKIIKRASSAVAAGGGMVIVLNLALVNADELISVTHLSDQMNSGDGQCELREAIINANNDNQSGSVDCLAGNGFDTIQLPEGTIILAQTGSDEDGTLTGDLDVFTGTQLLIQGQGITKTIINANQLDRVFHLFPSARLTLSNLTIMNGNINAPGGGIFSNNGQLILNNTNVFSNQSSSADGGGIYSQALSNTAHLTLTNSSVSSNVASRNGGGIATYADSNGTLMIDINNSVISGNIAKSSHGGGLHNYAYTGSINITLTDSEVTTNTANSWGGGISNYAYDGGATKLDINNSVISGNTAKISSGGGIRSTAYESGSKAELILENSTVSHNTARRGGGIYGYGGYGTSDMTVISSTITGNKATNGSGGGITNYAGYGANAVANLKVMHSTISGNTATRRGSGLYNKAYYDGSQATLHVLNSTITGNEGLVNGNGGGIANYTYYGEAQVHVTNSTISGNTVAEDGGGINNYAYQSSAQATIILTDTTVADNVAANGGGLANYAYQGNAQLTLTNSTISKNQANTNGGGLLSQADSGTAMVALTHTTIISNIADLDANDVGDGGGLHVQQATASHSLIANNQDRSITTTIHPDVSGQVTGDAYNLVSQITGISGTLGTGSDMIGQAQVSPLANHGGHPTNSGEPPYTHALLPNSLAIDAIPAGNCILNVDQRRISRPQQLGCDIGAFESQGFYLKVDDGNNQSTEINTQFPTPLQLTYLATDTNLLLGAGHVLSFTAPTSGPSLTTTLFTATTNSSGMVSSTVLANNDPGIYQVIVTTRDGNERAVFDLSNYITYLLNIVTAGPGSGSVDINPLGGTYPAGSVITLTAQAQTGSAFSGWSGDMVSTDNPLVLPLNSNLSLTATFNLLTYTLSLNTNGTGSGNVTASPTGTVHNYGTVVELIATPDNASEFSAWSGDLIGSNSPISLTIDANKAVTATFSQMAQPDRRIYLPTIQK